MYVAMYESTFVRSFVRTELCSIRYVANGTSGSICRRESAEYHRLHISTYLATYTFYAPSKVQVLPYILLYTYCTLFRTKVLSYSEVVVHRVTSGSTTIIQYVATYESTFEGTKVRT